MVMSPAKESPAASANGAVDSPAAAAAAAAIGGSPPSSPARISGLSEALAAQTETERTLPAPPGRGAERAEREAAERISMTRKVSAAGTTNAVAAPPASPPMPSDMAAWASVAAAVAATGAVSLQLYMLQQLLLHA